jgi:hypothetical protein
LAVEIMVMEMMTKEAKRHGAGDKQSWIVACSAERSAPERVEERLSEARRRALSTERSRSEKRERAEERLSEARRPTDA